MQSMKTGVASELGVLMLLALMVRPQLWQQLPALLEAPLSTLALAATSKRLRPTAVSLRRISAVAAFGCRLPLL